MFLPPAIGLFSFFVAPLTEEKPSDIYDFPAENQTKQSKNAVILICFSRYLFKFRGL